MVPDVMRAEVDQFLQPFFGEQFFDIRLTNAGSHSGEESLIQTVAEAPKSFVEDIFFPAALIADHFAAFDANQRRNGPNAAQLRGDFLGNELAVCEYLEVAARMRFEEV